MIPTPVALFAWILISILLFATKKPTRAFLLIYIVGILLLPSERGGEMDSGAASQGIIHITYSLVIDKYTACNLGALIGTVLFASKRLSNYRFNIFDVFYLAIPASSWVTSVVNGLGPHDGMSNFASNFIHFAPLIYLSKIHITKPSDLYLAFRALLGGAFVYAFVSVEEFRFSPQLHRMLYGYFQHHFVQAIRDGHFRPFGMLRHAIEFSFFMATSCLAAIWLHYRKLFPKLWGIVPSQVVVVALLIGLGCTMTFSGYLAVLLGMGLFFLFQNGAPRHLLLLLPLISASWITGRYLGIINTQEVISLAKHVSKDRADSLDYRFTAEDLHMSVGKTSPLWGKGGFGRGFKRTPTGGLAMAVDAFWLIQVNQWGIVGLVLWMLVWSGGIWSVWWSWDRFTPDSRPLATLVAVTLGLNLVNFMFNSAPSFFLMMLNFGVISVCLHLPRVNAAARSSRKMAAASRQPVAMRRAIPGQPMPRAR